MSLFSRVIMAHSGQPEIAKVNRKTGVLFLNSKIWDKLPADQKDFVLFHEEGHLRLQTNNEFQANQYAVSKFAPAGRFTNRELGQRIIVMKEILTRADEGFNPGFSSGLISEGIGSIFQNLQVLGIGSKARAKEATANAEAAAKIADVKGRANAKIILIVGVLIFITVITFLTLRK